jgi:hypothetical protein
MASQDKPQDGKSRVESKESKIGKVLSSAALTTLAFVSSFQAAQKVGQFKGAVEPVQQSQTFKYKAKAEKEALDVKVHELKSPAQLDILRQAQGDFIRAEVAELNQKAVESDEKLKKMQKKDPKTDKFVPISPYTEADIQAVRDVLDEVSTRAYMSAQDLRVFESNPNNFDPLMISQRQANQINQSTSISPGVKDKVNNAISLADESTKLHGRIESIDTELAARQATLEEAKPGIIRDGGLSSLVAGGSLLGIGALNKRKKDELGTPENDDESLPPPENTIFLESESTIESNSKDIPTNQKRSEELKSILNERIKQGVLQAKALKAQAIEKYNQIDKQKLQSEATEAAKATINASASLGKKAIDTAKKRPKTAAALGVGLAVATMVPNVGGITNKIQSIGNGSFGTRETITLSEVQSNSREFDKVVNQFDPELGMTPLNRYMDIRNSYFASHPDVESAFPALTRAQKTTEGAIIDLEVAMLNSVNCKDKAVMQMFLDHSRKNNAVKVVNDQS